MKRFNPFRMVTLILIVIVLVAVLLFFSGPYLKSIAESGLQRALATKVTFGSFKISPLSGSLKFTDLAIQDKEDPTKNLLQAKVGRASLSIGELLRGRAVVEEVVLSGVRMRVERREDGSLNVENLGKKGKPPPVTEEKKREAQKTDWVETLKKAAKKIKEWYEKRKAQVAKRKEEEKLRKKKVPPAKKVLTGRAKYVYSDRVSFVVKKILVEDLELELEDRTKKEPLPPITQAKAEVRNLSSRPMLYELPLTLSLEGLIGENGLGGKLSLQATLEVDPKKPGVFQSKLSGERLSLKLLKPLFGLSLPVIIEEGVCLLDSTLKLVGFNSLDLKPVVKLENLKLRPDGAHRKVVGIPAADFCEAVNRAGSLSLEGVRMEGPLDSPRIHWSKSFYKQIRKMLMAAGKKYLIAEVDRYLGPQVSEIRKEAEKVIGEKASKIFGKEAEKKAGSLLKKGLKLIPGLEKK